jgi:hypothetical protein
MNPRNLIRAIVAVALALLILLSYVADVSAKTLPGKQPANIQFTGTIVRHDTVFVDIVSDIPAGVPYETGIPYGWTYDPERGNIVTIYLCGCTGFHEVGFNSTPDMNRRIMLRFDIYGSPVDPFAPVGGNVEFAYDAYMNTLLVR